MCTYDGVDDDNDDDNDTTQKITIATTIIILITKVTILEILAFCECF